MKVVILAGGLGTRLPEYTQAIPKPMVEVGGLPILWHIMHIYARYHFEDFLVALGYKGEIIKRYFAQYRAMTQDFSVELSTGDISFHPTEPVDWKVTLVDTGPKTMTGGRVKRLAPHIGDERFFLTYGDGVADIDIGKLLDFHASHGRIATMSVVHPQSRYGAVEITDGRIKSFKEKPQRREGWINGGFFVLEPGIFEYIQNDATVFEREPLEHMARDGQLMPYRHEGFWYSMDTLREVEHLNDLWDLGQAPWKVW